MKINLLSRVGAGKRKNTRNISYTTLGEVFFKRTPRRIAAAITEPRARELIVAEKMQIDPINQPKTEDPIINYAYQLMRFKRDSP